MRAPKFRNANQEPRIYYGMHMEQGVCDYADPSFTGRILVKDEVIKQMNPTMRCKPWVVQHQDVTPENGEDLADGWVIDSFYNPADGKHWSKFMVVSDEGHAAIAKKWSLSNCYAATAFAPGGLWHAVPFDKEVMKGAFEHLACVPNPRYEASAKIGILTPEEFKSYNAEKDAELLQLANSKSPPPAQPAKEIKFMGLKIWQRKAVEKIENSADVESFMIELKSGRELTIERLVNEANEHETMQKDKLAKEEADRGKPVMANMEHRIKVGNDEMSVGDLVNKYNALIADPDQGGADKPGAQDAGGADKQAGTEEAGDKKNAGDKGAQAAADKDAKKAEEVANAEKVEIEKKQNAFFNMLVDAPALDAKRQAELKNAVQGSTVYESDDAQIERGQERYGRKPGAKTA